MINQGLLHEQYLGFWLAGSIGLLVVFYPVIRPYWFKVLDKLGQLLGL